MLDKLGNKIERGDILDSDDGYSVVVTQDIYGRWVGKLICAPDDSCANIPYALNEGRGYTKRIGGVTTTDYNEVS